MQKSALASLFRIQMTMSLESAAATRCEGRERHAAGGRAGKTEVEDQVATRCELRRALGPLDKHPRALCREPVSQPEIRNFVLAANPIQIQVNHLELSDCVMLEKRVGR